MLGFSPNRLAVSSALPAPTPPDMRVRIRQFQMPVKGT
jgi:hypothetical protein